MAGTTDAHLIPAPPSAVVIHNARIMIGVVIALSVLAFLLWVGRIYTRIVPVIRLAADDYVISAAYVLGLVDTILIFMTTPYMFGRDPSSITLADTENSLRYAILSQPIWAWTMAFIKISVLLMLRRVQTDKLWRRFSWVLMGVIIIITVYSMAASLTHCIPLYKAWDLLGAVKGGKCWPDKAARAHLFAVAAISFITDVIVALLPITFLRKVQRPIRERIIIGALMALGVFAGVASIIKIVISTRFGKTADLDLEGVQMSMWSLVEQLVGFIAACIPCLRSPFQRLLEYFGLASSHAKSRYGGDYGRGYGQVYANPSAVKSAFKSTAQSGMKMKNMPSADAASEENILANPREEGKDGEI